MGQRGLGRQYQARGRAVPQGKTAEFERCTAQPGHQLCSHTVCWNWPPSFQGEAGPPGQLDISMPALPSPRLSSDTDTTPFPCVCWTRPSTSKGLNYHVCETGVTLTNP